MKNLKESVRKPLPLAIATVLVSWQAAAFGQEEPADPAPVIEEQDAGESIDEVVVSGRFISSSQQLINERMNDAFATDLLGADTISRLGDSTVAAACDVYPGCRWCRTSSFTFEDWANAIRRRRSTVHRFPRRT